MTKPVRLAVFLGVSVVLHVVPWVFWPESGRQAAGDSDVGQVTLLPMPESFDRLVERWEEPVSVTDSLPDTQMDMSLPTSQIIDVPLSQPDMSAPLSKTAPTRPKLMREAMRPLADTRPPKSPAVTKKTPKRSKAVPAAKQDKNQPAKTSAKPQIAEQALGSKQSAIAGSDGRATLTTGDSQKIASRMNRWKAAIRQRIEQGKRRAGEKGTVKVSFLITTSGRVMSVRISGGSERLRAVTRTSLKRTRLPKAPRGVPRGSYPVVMTLIYRR